MSNAIKFTERGQVTLKITEAHHDADAVTLLFEIIDTGIGISTENIAKLWFDQVKLFYESRSQTVKMLTRS